MFEPEGQGGRAGPGGPAIQICGVVNGGLCPTTVTSTKEVPHAAKAPRPNSTNTPNTGASEPRAPPIAAALPTFVGAQAAGEAPDAAGAPIATAKMRSQGTMVPTWSASNPSPEDGRRVAQRTTAGSGARERLCQPQDGPAQDTPDRPIKRLLLPSRRKTTAKTLARRTTRSW